MSISFPIHVQNPHSSNHHNDLVWVGLPFAPETVRGPEHLRLLDPDGENVRAQFRVTGRWPDGSVRWALGRWTSNLPSGAEAVYTVIGGEETDAPEGRPVLEADGHALSVDTGEVRLALGEDPCRWIERIGLPARPEGQWVAWEPHVDGGQLFAALEDGHLEPRFDGPPEILDNGPVVGEAYYRGAFHDEAGTDRLRFRLRLIAATGSGLLRLSLTLHNPRHQPRLELGHFRLGLENAAMITDSGLQFSLPQDGVPFATLAGEPGRADYHAPLLNEACLYQDSSGGENWHHRNHVNRDWHIATTFRGYRIHADGIQSYSGDRSMGWGAVGDQRLGMALGVEKFWQNFPKAIRARIKDGRPVLSCSLFPSESRFPHELQGGEQKTHHVALSLHRTDRELGGDPSARPTPMVVHRGLKDAMERVLTRPPVLPSAEQVIDAGVVQPTAPYDPERFAGYEAAVASYADDPDCDLYRLREKWDEYGWRNFGDVIADCELGGRILSHYNLEYDLSRGMLLQALRRSGHEARQCAVWLDLGLDAARHQADIDLYHTSEDPHGGYVYNGGKFTHTAHALEPGRGTHRGQDSLQFWGDLDWPWGRGGGPESGHFDNEGLLLAYHLTGAPVLLEAALEIADLAAHKVLNDQFAQFDYDRSSGNNTSVCTHAWIQTGDDKYLRAVEVLLENTRLAAVKGDRPADEEGLCPIGGWSASIFLKATLWFLTQYERLRGQRHEAASEVIREYRDSFHKYGWSEEAGCFAETIHPDASRNRYIVYDAAWHTVDALAWAAMLCEDPSQRAEQLRRAIRAFEKFCCESAPKGRPKYRSTKAATYIANNGHSVLAALWQKKDRTALEGG